MLLELNAEHIINEDFKSYAGFSESIANPLLKSLAESKQLIKFFDFKDDKQNSYLYVSIPKTKEFDGIFKVLNTYGITLSSLVMVISRGVKTIRIPTRVLATISKALKVGNDTIVSYLTVFFYSLAVLLNIVLYRPAFNTSDIQDIKAIYNDYFKTLPITIEANQLEDNTILETVRFFNFERNMFFNTAVRFPGSFELQYNVLTVENGDKNTDILAISEKKDCGKIMNYITEDNLIYTNNELTLWLMSSPENFLCNLVVNIGTKLNSRDIITIQSLDKFDTSAYSNVSVGVDALKFDKVLELYSNLIESSNTEMHKKLFGGKISSSAVSVDLKDQYKDDKYAQKLYTQIQDYYENFDLKELTTVVKGFAKGQVYSLMFEGVSGTGKSTAAKVIPSRCGLPYIVKNFSTNSEESDLIGTMVPNTNKEIYGDTEFRWKDGLLTKAVRNGYCFIGEEVNFARPGVLGMLNSLLDESRQIELPTGEIVKAHKNFRIIVTCNIGYEGTNRLNKAFVNRFEVVKKFEDLDYIEMCNIIHNRCGYTDDSKISKIVDVYKAIKKYSKEQNLDLVISIRQLMNIFSQGKYYKSAKIALEHLMLDQAFLEDAEHLEYFKKDVISAFDLDWRI